MLKTCSKRVFLVLWTRKKRVSVRRSSLKKTLITFLRTTRELQSTPLSMAVIPLARAALFQIRRTPILRLMILTFGIRFWRTRRVKRCWSWRNSTNERKLFLRAKTSREYSSLRCVNLSMNWSARNLLWSDTMLMTKRMSPMSSIKLFQQRNSIQSIRILRWISPMKSKDLPEDLRK